MLPETDELRMVGIAFGLASQYGTGEQPFTPHGSEAFHIQIFGVYGPQPHNRYLVSAR